MSTIKHALISALTIDGARNAQTAALILKAGKAAASMLSLCKEAAQQAAAQLNPETPMRERVDAVVALYAQDFATAGHNVRALFKDALTLHAAAATPVTVSAMVDGKKQDVHTTAGEAASMPKHAMRDAAKQVREATGTARKAGGGRKTTASEKMQAAEQAVGLDNVTMTQVDIFANWLDALPEYLGDAVYHPRIVAALIGAGYSLNKAAKGRVISKG